MKSKLELPGDGPELTAALRRIAELEAENAALKAALEPFASIKAEVQFLLARLDELEFGSVSV